MFDNYYRVCYNGSINGTVLPLSCVCWGLNPD
ncbi:hypothetical protein [Bacillus phage phi29]|uniref:Uncharacterized protein n=2 Tax=Salasvirus phi29 TaxID=10756 RepID=B3VMN1_BPPH2|nr:hypothetical protein phi29_gp0.2 [Bacillus phage phi29]ACE96018.1 hypothetical protein [Bacillus phage phi29]CAA24474.1 unnamed protein product [Bacillus phage phi29]